MGARVREREGYPATDFPASGLMLTKHQAVSRQERKARTAMRLGGLKN